MLNAARELFFERGYERTCVEDVVRRVGGSKASLYSYFGSKEGLFGEIIEQRVDEIVRYLHVPAEADAEVETALQGIAHRYAVWLLSRNRCSLRRVIFAEALRFPQLARRYHEATLRVRGFVAKYLEAQHAAGRLRCADSVLMASFFLELVEGAPLTRSLLGLPAFADEAALEQHVGEAVRLFLHGCAAPGSGSRPPGS